MAARRKANFSVAAQLRMEHTLERIMVTALPHDCEQLCHDIWSSGIGVKQMNRLALLFEEIAVAVGGEEYKGASRAEGE